MRCKEVGKYLAVLSLGSLILPSLATAAVSISDVVNAASRIPSGFPSYGVAQGAPVTASKTATPPIGTLSLWN
jgi:hypothetical protein